MKKQLLTIDDLEEAARATLPRPTYEYFRAGADAEVTLRRNREAFQRWEIWPRVLMDVTQRELRRTLLGVPVSMPILIAPSAFHQLAHPDGEVATARGAAEAGTIMVVSMHANIRLEEVAAAATGPKCFQLYIQKDRGLTQSLIERAQAAGYIGLVLSVDLPVRGRRLSEERSAFTLPPELRFANLYLPGDTLANTDLAAFTASQHDASLTWRDVEWVQSVSRVPVVMKGLVRADDARTAAAMGVRAVIVSNHGGRQLDGMPSTLEALPAVVEAIADRCEVWFDGGIRWGTDVLKALALGARAVLVGRPILWGLAVDGAAGVARVLGMLTDELSRAMALAGCPDLASIRNDIVRPASPARQP